MIVTEAQNLKPGDVVFVRMRVTSAPKAGTMAHSRGWINVQNINDTDLLGEQDVIVSCSDAVTPADLKAWKNVKADKNVPKPDIRHTDWRLVETGFATWQEASARLRQLKEAGYHGMAADVGDHINIVIDGGKRGRPIEEVPAKFCSPK